MSATKLTAKQREALLLAAEHPMACSPLTREMRSAGWAVVNGNVLNALMNMRLIAHDSATELTVHGRHTYVVTAWSLTDAGRAVLAQVSK